MSRNQRSQGGHPDGGQGGAEPEAADRPVPQSPLSPQEAPDPTGPGLVGHQVAAVSEGAQDAVEDAGSTAADGAAPTGASPAGASPDDAEPDTGAGAEDAGLPDGDSGPAADAGPAHGGAGDEEGGGPDNDGPAHAGDSAEGSSDPADDVARPPAAASEDEAATPAEAGPETYGITPAQDQGAHMISWIQHGGGKLPPSIAPAMPPVAPSAPSGDPDPAPQESTVAPGGEGFESSITPAVAAHTERVWSEPGHDASETVLGESRWPALRAESAQAGAAESSAGAAASPAAPGGAAPSGPGSPAPAGSPATANWATAPAWPIPAGQSGADSTDDDLGAAPNQGGADEASADAPAQEADGAGARGDAASAAAAVTAAPRRRRLLAVGAAAGITILLAWGALAWWTTQHIASGTTVSGVDLSGLSPEQAGTRLGEQIGAQLAQPVTLTVGQGSSELVPAESGVSLDAEATMDQVAGFTLNPLTIAQRLGGAQSDAVLRVDSETLTGALEDRIDSMANGAVSATVSLEGTQVTTTPAQDGVGLDVKASVEQLSRGWPLGQQSIALAEGVAVPAITDQEAKDFVDSTLSPMLSADMAITAVGTQVESKATTPTVTLTPEQTASMTSISTDGGRLAASIDTTMLHDTIVGTMGEVEKPAIDASWTIDGTQTGAAGDKPQYVAPAEGTGIDMDSLTQSLTTTAAKGTDPASRTVALPLSVLKPEDTTPEADWGVKEVVGEYSTPYNAGDLPRTQNLRRGAELINGSVVKPGEVFSLEEALGEVDYEHGFADAGVISNGEHIDSLGGGLSQVATTVFNAGFEAGMDDTEHHPHQYYFDRYPAGREATLWTGKLDVKFTNPTPHGVLVQAWLDGEQIHVRLWSTKYYDVTITESERYNFRPVVTERKSGPQCQPYTGGNPGFDITVTRKRSHNGQAVPDDVLTTAYYPDNNIICG
ncbi:VanW family protein [Actinomyces bowdenii]|uniref:VanW family protein n=1 Tax=Actinomyces bowdenii TaxID=131109 RepID=UPI001ABD4425|nr:VanW family protein [Actinomyces bowdenii]MBO3725391.1 VanW family protein [Actinomyces bowdenii]